MAEWLERACMDSTSIFTREEVLLILDDLRTRASETQDPSVWTNLAIFRLCTGCGLRANEVSLLNIGDMHLEGGKPHIALRKETTKRNKARNVPLWWDLGTFDDLRMWCDYRVSQMACDEDPVVCIPNDIPDCKLGPVVAGGRFTRWLINRRFKKACRALPRKRRKLCNPRMGRHTFASFALAAGRTLPEVQAAMGHGNILTTSIYLHIAVDDDGTRGNIFEKPNTNPRLSDTDMDTLRKAAELVERMRA